MNISKPPGGSSAGLNSQSMHHPCIDYALSGWHKLCYPGSRAGRTEEMRGKSCLALYGGWALVRHFTQLDLVAGGHS